MATVQEQSVEEGVSRTFDAPYRPVAAAIVDGIEGIRFEVTKVEENAENVVILFVRPVSHFQWGGAGRAIIAKAEEGKPTSVTINYTRRFGVSGGGPEGVSRNIFARAENKLVGTAAKP